MGRRRFNKLVYRLKKNNLIKSKNLKQVAIISLVELEDYLNIAAKQHFIVKPVRPKLLLSLIRSIMNNEEMNWLQAK